MLTFLSLLSIYAHLSVFLGPLLGFFYVYVAFAVSLSFSLQTFFSPFLLFSNSLSISLYLSIFTSVPLFL